jgi:CRP-like cAMP-binding protein
VTKDKSINERQIETGGVIYREGDPGDAMFFLQEGEVEILRETQGESVRLAVLRRGAIFGETGVLRDKPRSTTVRALSQTKMVVLAKDDFLHAFGGEKNALALRLLRMLCGRLMEADDQLLEQHNPAAGGGSDKIGRIRLIPDSPLVENQIGRNGIDISSLPYSIGCHTITDHQTSLTPTKLLIRSPGNIQITGEHLLIEERRGDLVARDLGSHLGSLVNGIRIANFEQDDEAILRFGDNDLQLGSIDSPFRFRVIVERAQR